MDGQSSEGSHEPRMSAHTSDVVVEVRPICKRTWTAAEKLQIMRDALKPDACPAEIIRRYGISSQAMSIGLGLLAAASLAGLISATAAPRSVMTTPSPRRTRSMSSGSLAWASARE